MIKQLVTSAFFIASAIGVKAQYNFSQIHNQHAHNLASSRFLSLLGDDMRTGEIHLLNLYGGFANNFISAYDLQQFYHNQEIYRIHTSIMY